MSTHAKRLAAACALAVAFAGLGATAAHAEPEPNCVGVPTLGGVFYNCVTVSTGIVPTIGITGVTHVGATVPPVCYFLDCTEPTPVGGDVPVQPRYLNPPSDVLVADVRTNCGTTNGCYDGPGTATYRYYRVRYVYVYDRCFFESNDPNFSQLNGTSLPCTI